MELGIFAKTFRRPTVGAAPEAAKVLGLGCVQFYFECAGLSSMPEAVPPSTLSAIASASRETGVRLRRYPQPSTWPIRTGSDANWVCGGCELSPKPRPVLVCPC